MAFEIVGRPQNNQSDMLRTLLESKYRSDALAQAKAEMKAQERQAQLDRLHQTELEAVKQKNAESLAKTQQKLSLDETRKNELHTQMKHIRDISQAKAMAERMRVEGIQNVDEILNVKMEQIADMNEFIANKMVSENSWDRQLASALQARKATGSGVDAEFFQPEVAMANFEQNQVARERNEITTRQVNAQLKQAGLDEQKIEQLKLQTQMQYRASVVQARGNIGSSLINDLTKIITDEALDPNVAAAQMTMILEMGQNMYEEASQELALANGNLSALAQTNPMAAEMISSMPEGSKSFGVIANRAIDDALKTLKAGPKKTAAKETAKLFRKAGGGYTTYVSEAPDAVRALKTYIEEQSLGKDNELSVLLEWLTGKQDPSDLTFPSPRVIDRAKSLVPGIGDLTIPVARRNR